MFSPLRATSSSFVSIIFCLSSLALRFVSCIIPGVGVLRDIEYSMIFYFVSVLFRSESSIFIGVGVLKAGRFESPRGRSYGTQGEARKTSHPERPVLNSNEFL